MAIGLPKLKPRPTHAAAGVAVPFLLKGREVPAKYTAQAVCGNCGNSRCTVVCYDCEEVWGHARVDSCGWIWQDCGELTIFFKDRG